MPNPRHKQSKSTKQAGFHQRNQHQGKYDIPALINADMEAGESSLSHFASRNSYGDLSIDFTNAKAVKALNRALLQHQYGIVAWDIPEGYLCPPVPGRADYIHGLADLLIAANQGKSPKKHSVYVLDIGTGANGIYPLIGSQEYTWNFVATDINPEALANLQLIIQANASLSEKIELRLQQSPQQIFQSVVHQDEWFDLTMCNPPFHKSASDANRGTNNKWQNLGKTFGKAEAKLNFGGQAAELWCPGGELQFIAKMIEESRELSTRCYWFSSLISKSVNLDPIKAKLKQFKALEFKLISMQQGSKRSRFIAWTFLTPAQQSTWAKLRWR